MFKRLFFALLGLGAGVTLGVWAVRKVDAARQRLTPEQIARSASARTGAFGSRLADAVAEGRAAAAARESELRAVYRTTPPEELGEEQRE